MSPKALVTFVALLLTFSSATVILSHILVIGFGQVVTQVVRFTLTCVLAYSLVQGWHPARWIAAALLAMAGGFAVVFAFSGRFSPMSLALISVHLFCLFLLLTPYAGRHFTVK